MNKFQGGKELNVQGQQQVIFKVTGTIPSRSVSSWCSLKGRQRNEVTWDLLKDCRNEEVSRSTERRVQGQQKDDDRDGGTTLGAHVTREAKGRHLGANDAHSHVDGDAQNDDDDVNQLYQKRWSSKH